MMTITIFGESGVGKTWLGTTAPGPRLILDVEGRTRFAPTKKGSWNPMAQPPKADEIEETTVAVVRDFQTFNMAFQWLASGQHPWKSVVLDSVTELQKRVMDETVGTRMPETQDWGTVLRRMEALIRSFRDLTNHPTNPLDMVVFIAMAHVKDSKYRPMLQGQIASTFPYYVDVLGYMYVSDDNQRHLLVQPRDGNPGFMAKDATDTFGAVVTQPNLTEMLQVLKDKFNL